MVRSAAGEGPAPLPEWIPPQLTQLVQEAPDGLDWLHEIKFDGKLESPVRRGAAWPSP
jgi:ATP-dependent DNA ligase